MNAKDLQFNHVAEYIQALMIEAERQAVLVNTFLTTLSAAPGFRWLAKRPVALPEGFLFGLGSALRLSQWEAQGLAAYLGASLPSATEAVLDVFRAVLDEKARARTAKFIAELQRLYFSRFSWMASIELDADMLLGNSSEDALVDAVADLVWKFRKAVSVDLT
jgi:hypothetical protein